ncbi:MAG: aminomethyl-transferring glycine dehydrogenase subunit GcvPA [Gammaproteobacteria bacterium]|nr:aminomethyl-transferring glycine dehydrogenase subunit GcvPA [Gammaproteobacteria bacterium]
MPFIPHTESEIKEMLAIIGASSVDALFDEIPAALRAGDLTKVPPALNEMEISRLMHKRAELDGRYLNFIGAGAYEHHIPAAIWEITTRGEFYSAYTPYQAEASQGTLQLIYEYQSMITALTGMDAANASLYDGASALAEAVLMAVRVHKKSQKILMPRTVHPVYRQVVHALVKNQDIELVEVDYDRQGGHVAADALKNISGKDFAALVVPQPNFFGVLEDVDALTSWAHEQGMLVIALVNPMSLALLTAPGQWGNNGADIVIGEGQSMGVPLSSGGPYFGFMCCKQQHIRQMPGRIVGKTVDLDGKTGFTLTLQAREQHIRRSKATSNICTNQGLMVTAATIYMALMGPQGLKQTAAASHANTRQLLKRLTDINGIESVFNRPYFHEAPIKLDSRATDVLRALEAQGIVGGYSLSEHYPELGESILVCATETKTAKDIEQYAFHMERIISKRRLDPPCAVKVSNTTPV